MRSRRARWLSAPKRRGTGALAIGFALAAALAADGPRAAQAQPNTQPQPHAPQTQPNAPQAQPKAPQAQPNAQKPTSAKGETPAVVLNDEDVSTVLGQKVFSTAGKNMGRVVDIIVDRKGVVRAAVIDFGGFLGVGSRKVAVDWQALHFPPKGKLDRLTLSLSDEQVRLAPEYKPGEPIVVVGATSGAARAVSPPAPASGTK